MKRDRLLVVYSGWLGDLMWIIPTVHALKSAFEKVSLVVSGVQAGLAEVMKGGLIEDVYIDSPSQRLATARRTREAVLADGTDTFIDLKGRWKTGIYMPWGRKLTILLPHRQDAREHILARLVHPGASTMPARTADHMVDAYLSGLSGLDIQSMPISFDLPFADQAIEAGEEIVKREGLRDRRSVALNLGSAQFSKIWPAENYRRLAEVLTNDLDCKVIIMGAREFVPNDNYDMRAAAETFKGTPFTNLVAETSLPTDSYLLSSGVFTLSVGNDSFAGHMAGSANEVGEDTPGAVRADNGQHFKANHTISLFGPTNPVFCRPYDPTGAFNTIVMPESYPTDCVYDRKAHTCPHYGDKHCLAGAHCMRNLTVDQVVAAVEKKLRECR